MVEDVTSDLETPEDVWNDPWWVAQRKRVLNSKRGKAALQDLERALLRMPHKRLIAGGLCDGETGVCAMGAWLYRHHVDNGMNPKDTWRLLRSNPRSDWFNPHTHWIRTLGYSSRALGISRTLVEIVVHISDYEAGDVDMPLEARYDEVLRLVRSCIAASAAA